jgi:hypothetical protein
MEIYSLMILCSEKASKNKQLPEDGQVSLKHVEIDAILMLF